MPEYRLNIMMHIGIFTVQFLSSYSAMPQHVEDGKMCACTNATFKLEKSTNYLQVHLNL